MGTGSKRPVDVPQIGVITETPESFNPLFCAQRPAFNCDTCSDYQVMLLWSEHVSKNAAEPAVSGGA